MIVSLTSYQENIKINWLKLHHIESMEQITVIIIILKKLLRPKYRRIRRAKITAAIKIFNYGKFKKIESPNADKFQTLVKEFKIFEANGKRSSNLQNFLDVLLTIKPTYNQKERNFSTATDFVKKIERKLEIQLWTFNVF